MSSVLTADAGKWQELIEGSSGECLFSALSAKNVDHVLSTATVRGPQKKLCAAVLPFVPKMLSNRDGLVILGSLTRYGTPRTVGLISSAILKAQEDVWTFKAQPADELLKYASALLERLVYREDCSDEDYNKIVRALKAANKGSMFGSAFTLPAAGRLMTIDPEFAKQVANNAQVKKALNKVSFDSATRAAALECCLTILKGAPEGRDDALHSVGSTFVCSVFADNLEKDAAKRPREEVMLALVSGAPESVVDTVSECLATWPNLADVCRGASYSKVVAVALDRCSNVKVGVSLVKRAFNSVGDVDEKLASRKTAFLHLLSSVGQKSAYAEALDKQIGSPQGKKLVSAAALYRSATMPKAVATQNSIMQKLKMLKDAGAAEAKKKAVKRPRE